MQSAGGERERLRRFPVQPLRVVQQEQQRLIGGGLGQQCQRRKADQIAVRGQPRHEAQGRVQRGPLRAGQPARPVEERPQQPVQGAEAETGLGLDRGQPDHAQFRGPGRGVLQQSGLADPGFAGQDECSAEAVAHRLEQSSDGFAFGVAADHRRPGCVLDAVPHHGTAPLLSMS